MVIDGCLKSIGKQKNSQDPSGRKNVNGAGRCRELSASVCQMEWAFCNLHVPVCLVESTLRNLHYRPIMHAMVVQSFSDSSNVDFNSLRNVFCPALAVQTIQLSWLTSISCRSAMTLFAAILLLMCGCLHFQRNLFVPIIHWIVKCICVAALLQMYVERRSSTFYRGLLWVYFDVNALLSV